MKVYLINPKFPITYWGFEYANDLTSSKYTSPPLGLATIAALTPAGITVEICDENIESIDFDTDADIIGLTAYLVQEERAFAIAREFQRRGKFVVFGGPITTLKPDVCKDYATIVFRGEAEYTWPQFFADFQAGSPCVEYVQTESVDLRDSPVPRFDLLKLDQYSKAGIQTTRGCPFQCEFCDIVVLFGRKVRCKAVTQVIDEMRTLAQLQVGSIFFTDDNFVGNPGYAKELLRAMIAFQRTQRIPLQYMAQASLNLARDEELLRLMHDAHFTKVFVGIESPRKACLQEAHKGQNLRADLVADIKTIQSYNIGVAAGMIVGFDHDDAQSFQEHFDFIMESNVAWVMTGLLQAFPLTPLYERLQREHRLDLTSATDGNNTSLNSNIIPQRMTKGELITGYLWLQKQLYSYENYAQRVIGMLSDYAHRPKLKSSLPTLADLKIVARTFRYYVLTLNRTRRKFSWKILYYVFSHKPALFHVAITYMVGFKHLHAYVYEQLEKANQTKALVMENLGKSVSNNAAALSQHTALLSAKLEQRMSCAPPDVDDVA